MSSSTPWDLRIESYETEVELLDRLKLFVADVMNRELYGDLDQLCDRQSATMAARTPVFT